MSNTTQPATIGPSALVTMTIRPMSKLLNPLVAKLAGRRRFRTVAALHHVGRRTGAHYVTSVGARVADGVVLIPLTFGNSSDWARNVAAAGQCWVRADGATYHAVGPRFVTTSEAAPLLRATFGPAERIMFKAMGIKQFMLLRVTG